MLECTCCKDCEKRELYCHSVCEEYIAFRTAKDEENAKIRAVKEAEIKRRDYIEKMRKREKRAKK